MNNRQIPEDKLIELSEAARTWCKRAFLLESGKIVRGEELQKLSIQERWSFVAFADGVKVTII